MVKTMVVALLGLRSTRLRMIVANSVFKGKEESSCVVGSTVYGSTHDYFFLRESCNEWL